MHIRYLIILLCLCIGIGTSCLSLDLSKQNEIVLKDFFRCLFENSEGSYVLFGKKPVCINGYNLKDRFRLETDLHKMSVYLREGARVWKKLHLGKSESNIIIHIYDNEDSLAENWVHILVINRELFVKTVNANLSLFQYVLGPTITPLALLEKLTDSKQTFHGVLKNDKVLIGILLGFGTQNALYVSRLEELEDNDILNDIPPYKSHVLHCIQQDPHLKDKILLSEYSEEHSKDLKPSFGYKSISEEMADLYSKLEISSQKLAQRTPQYVFGRLKNDNETDEIIKELEETQALIAEKLKSDDFLMEVLAEIFPSETFSTQKEDSAHFLFSFKKDEIDQMGNIVAVNIFEQLKNENDDYIEAFFRGMKDANLLKLFEAHHPRSSEYNINKVLLKANENIKNCDKKFHQIHQDKRFACLIPFKLYSRTLTEGSGEKLLDQTNVIVHYTMKANDHLLCDTRIGGIPKEMDLSQTISGFAHGVQGMHVGEIREILIHPSLGYGLYTTLDKGAELQAVVQLEKILEGSSTKLPKLEFDEIAQDIKPDLEMIIKDQAKEVGYFFGYQSWKHYRHGNMYYNLNQILQIIKKLRHGENIQIPPFIDIHELLNQLHWNIYHQ